MHHLPSSDLHHHNQDRYKNVKEKKVELVMIDRFLWPQNLYIEEMESSSAVVKCTSNKKKSIKKQGRHFSTKSSICIFTSKSERMKNINQILRVRLDCIREIIIAKDRDWENKLLISPTMKVPINLSTSLKTFCLHSVWMFARDNHKNIWPYMDA